MPVLPTVIGLLVKFGPPAYDIIAHWLKKEPDNVELKEWVEALKPIKKNYDQFIADAEERAAANS